MFSVKDRKDCTSTSCYNGGTCIDGNFDFLCRCPAGFSGKTCQCKLSPQIYFVKEIKFSLPFCIGMLLTY